MIWLIWNIVFGVGCCALSVATWFLFKPDRFYAPPHQLWSIMKMIALIILMVLWILAEFKLSPMSYAKSIRAAYLGIFLVETHGRAIWYHIENATRTPRELWNNFFGT